MKREIDNDIIIFLFELILALMIPFIACALTLSPKEEYSNALLGLIAVIGRSGSLLLLLFGIPLGTVGIIFARKAKKLRIATIALSILNLLVGIIEVVILILIICAVVFGGLRV